jgi:hypothetical protein
MTGQQTFLSFTHNSRPVTLRDILRHEGNIEKMKVIFFVVSLPS